MNNLSLEILNDDPFKMHVSGTNRDVIKVFLHVWGLFSTSGWTKPNLVQRVPRPGNVPTVADSFAEFDFFAEPPPAGSIVFDALTPLLCIAVIELPSIVHGVRVYGQNNFQDKLVRFDSFPSGVAKSNGGDFVPIPWLVTNTHLGIRPNV